jgi:hypothetical protein
MTVTRRFIAGSLTTGLRPRGTPDLVVPPGHTGTATALKTEIIFGS